MINFNNLDGFVVDMRTNNDCDAILEDILSGDGVMCEIMQHTTLDLKREFINNYFTTTYKQVFLKKPHILVVCEEELYTQEDLDDNHDAIKTRDDMIEDMKITIAELRKLNEDGLQYATSRDNKIEELEDFIGAKAVELLKLEDQLETLTQELLKAQQVIEHKDGLLKNFVDKHLKQLDKIKEIINDER